jgi:hypothetical protein
MKKNILVFYYLSLFIFLSCKNGVNIKIVNSSNSNIKEIIIETGFSSQTLENFKTNETKKIFVDFKENKTNFDGIMELTTNRNDSLKKYFFGYYSNGLPPDDMKIIIKKDTILFD